MSVFRSKWYDVNKWYDIVLNLRTEDTPREITLRDIQYHKIKGSRKLEFGLNCKRFALPASAQPSLREGP